MSLHTHASTALPCPRFEVTDEQRCRRTPPSSGARGSADEPWQVFDWPTVERELGTRLPADYKMLAELIAPERESDIVILPMLDTGAPRR